jgi:hypothetical protein
MGKLTGYNGPYGGSTDVVKAICNQGFLPMSWAETVLADWVFSNNFMPYARAHWVYDGRDSNCGDLSEAFIDTWYYIRTTKHPQSPLSPAMNHTVPGPLLSAPRNVFAGPACGNVRAVRTGALDRRCIFGNHQMCRIATRYYDPTYNHMDHDPEYFLESKVTTVGQLRIKPDFSFVYVRSTTGVTGFGDSWDEMNGAGWISAADWLIKTARTGHTRSRDLQRLDRALAGFEAQGHDGLAELRAAFQNWYDHNDKEASTRNKDGCVIGLKNFLGL